MRRLYRLVLSATATALIATACAPPQQQAVRAGAPGGTATTAGKADQYVVVDCALPGQVRKLGSQFNYIAPRRPARLPAAECEIRGGEYVSFDRANQATSLLVWLDAAKGGDAEAQTYVGEIYEKGLGVPPDYPTAFAWYSRAAKQGNTRAQINLGHLYEQGLGVQRDPVAALNWYRKASGFAGSEVALVSAVEVTSRDSRIRQLEESLESSEGRVAQLETQSVQLRSEIGQLSNRRRQLARQLRDAQRAPRELTVNIAKVASDRSKLAEEAQGLRVDHAAQREQSQALRAELVESQKSSNVLASELSAVRAQLDAALSAQARQSNTGQQAALLTQQLREREAELVVAQKRAEQAAENEQALRFAISEANQTENSLREQVAKLTAEAERIDTQARQAAQNADAQQQSQRNRYLELEAQIAQSQTALDTAIEDLGRERGARQVVERRLRQQESEIAALNTVIKESQVSGTSANAQLDELTKSIAASEAAAAESRRREQTLERRLNRKADEVRSLRQRLARAANDLAKERDQSAISMQVLESEKADIEAKLEQKNRELASLQSQQSVIVADVGPSIEIISPQVEILRGTPTPTITRNTDVNAVEVVGRIDAPRGLRSFQVNYQPNTVGANGKFQVQVPLAAGDTPIRLTAIDSNNEKAEFEFVVERVAKTVAVEAPASSIGGQYHALLIGNNDYRHLPKLQSARNDVNAVAATLKQRYGFNTRVLEDATREQILEALYDIRGRLKKDDRLLIYYAGSWRATQKPSRESRRLLVTGRRASIDTDQLDPQSAHIEFRREYFCNPCHCGG